MKLLGFAHLGADLGYAIPTSSQVTHTLVLKSAPGTCQGDLFDFQDATDCVLPCIICVPGIMAS